MRTKENISVVINARVNSIRLHHKLIRPFCDTTLIDLALGKLSELDMPNKYLAACEPEILNIYQKYKDTGIKLINRDNSSVESKLVDQNIIFAHYKRINTPYIMSINPCMPFVKVDTFLDIVNYFFSNTQIKTLTSVRKRDNIFFDKEFKPLNVSSDIIVTQNNPPIYEMAHVFHIFDRDYFIKNGTFWDYSVNNPAYFVIGDPLELLDIDEEIEFIMISSLYDRLVIN